MDYICIQINGNKVIQSKSIDDIEAAVSIERTGTAFMVIFNPIPNKFLSYGKVESAGEGNFPIWYSTKENT